MMEGKKEIFFLALILFFTFVFALSHLTTRPKLSFDEGLTIEIARNFLLFKKLDVSTAPGVFSGRPYVVGTNGYPVTVPLAGVFALFDFGLKQARIYMLFWLIAVLISLYFLVKKIFDKKTALVSLALIATFAPFYGHGLMATGELPGFFFLVWGLFFLFKAAESDSGRLNYFSAGLFFALAAASKPSIYLLLFPTLLLFLLFEERQRFFSKLFFSLTGALPAFFVWVWLIFPAPFIKSTWQEAINFYRYPYGPDFSVWQSVLKNLGLIINHSTLIYFILLTLVIIYWFFANGRKETIKKKPAVFFFIYSVFSFIYFLKSPGWLRYIIGFQLLAFIFVFPSISVISEKIFRKGRLLKIGAISGLVILLSVQTIQLFFFNSALSSPYPKRAADVINQKLAENNNYQVGIIQSPDIASLIHPLKKFHIVKVAWGIPAFGQNPLSFSKDSLPRFIAFHGESDFVAKYKSALEENYIFINGTDGYSIYERK